MPSRARRLAAEAKRTAAEAAAQLAAPITTDPVDAHLAARLGKPEAEVTAALDADKTADDDLKPGTGAASIRANDAATSAPASGAKPKPKPKMNVEERIAKFAEYAVSRKGSPFTRADAAAELGCSELVIGYVAPDERVTKLLKLAGVKMTTDKKTYSVS